MSESDTESGGGKGGPKRPPGRRPKPPVTIDLAATPSGKNPPAGKDEPRKDEPSPKADSPVGSPLATAAAASSGSGAASGGPPAGATGPRPGASPPGASTPDRPAAGGEDGSKPDPRPDEPRMAAAGPPPAKPDEPDRPEPDEARKPELTEKPAPPEPPLPSPPPLAARPVSPIPPRPERQKTDWSSAGRLIAAGVFGGAIATVLGILYHASGIIPTRADLTAADAVRQAQATEEKVDAFEGRLSALEDATSGLAALTEKVNALEKLEDTNRSRIENLENARPTGGSGGGNGQPVSLGPIESRLSEAERSIATLSDRIGALTGRVEEIASRPPPAAESERAARAVAIGLLRQGAASGGSFSTDLAMLKALGLDGDDVAALEPLARNGAPTVATLQASFPSVADAILAATSSLPEDAGFVDRLFAFGNGLVTVRPTAPIEGDTPEAVVSRMQDHVARGDLAAALDERQKLPESGQNASATWASAARDRIQIDTIVERLALSVAPPPAN